MPSRLETRICGQADLAICVLVYFLCPIFACASLVRVIFGASGSLTITVTSVDFAGFVFLTMLARWRGKQLASDEARVQTA